MKISVKLSITSLAIALIIISMGVASFFSSDGLIESTSWVVHTQEVLENLENLRSSLIDAETGQRGFLFTNEERYLEPYNSALESAYKDLAIVRELTADNPIQQRNLDRLEPLIDEKFDELEETIYLHKAGKTQAAKDLVLTDKGKNIMDEIRSLIDEMKVEEAGLLVERRALPEKLRKTNNFVVVVFISLGLFLSLLISLIVSRSIITPINKLMHLVEEVKKGNFKARSNIKTKDEFQRLGDSFDLTTQALDNIDKERKQLEAAKTRFLSITSHELRSPMTPMKAQLQMLEGEYFGKINEKQKKSVQTVIRNADRLDRIIADFLEISRIEAARLKFIFKKASLSNVAQNLIEDMKGFMPEKKIALKTAIGKLPMIECDPDRVSQVLRNLINNAIKFTPEGGTITVSATARQTDVLFSVKDTGIGIKQEDQQKIFEPFFQAEQTMYRKKGGTGLGLAISRGIVMSQNGKMWVESVVGKGTTFYFTVPLTPVRKIKPIKVLFSTQDDTEGKLKALFSSLLGPMGGREFELIKKEGISVESVTKLFTDLEEQGIIDKGEWELPVESLFGKSEERFIKHDNTTLRSKRSGKHPSAAPMRKEE